MSNRRKKKAPLRIDKIIGMITILTILICGAIIFIDFSRVKNEGFIQAGTNKGDLDFKENPTDTLNTGTESAINDIEIESLQKRYTVCLDAAHGGVENGKVSGNVKEKDVVLGLVLKIGEILEGSGVKVVLTRDSDTAYTDYRRVAACKDSGAHLAVSIRMDAVEAGSMEGTKAWIYSGKPEESKEAAELIMKSIERNIPVNSRGVGYGCDNLDTLDFYFNSANPCTSLVLQLGSVYNQSEVQAYVNNSDNSAAAIANGIIEYLKTLE